MLARAFLVSLTMLCLSLCYVFIASAQAQTTTADSEQTTETTGTTEALETSDATETPIEAQNVPESGEEAPAVNEELPINDELQINNEQQDGSTVVAPEEFNPIDISYRIVGESESFQADVEEAFTTWQDASVGAIEARQEEAANVIFELTDAALMGPDTISLKLQNFPETSILLTDSLAETSPNLYKSALLHEVGILAGLPLKDFGVMTRGLSADTVPSVSVAEARALEAQASTAKEDINRDGQIDFYDLVELAKNYVEFPQNYSADLTGDGSINADDVKQLQEVYEFSDPVDVNATATDESETQDRSDSTTTDSTTTDSPTTGENINPTEALEGIEDAVSELDAPDGVAGKLFEAAKVITEEVTQVEQEKELDSTSENPTQEGTSTESSTTESSTTEEESGGQ